MSNMKHIINLPTPSSISYMWNFGSLLGFCLSVQIISGFFLSIHYQPNVEISFQEILNYCNEVSNGWLVRFIHSSGATLFFCFCYMHIGKALMYDSYYFFTVWLSGTLMLLLIMGSAFLGYVLPWGQMSFWGATVITNLISVIPFIGTDIVEWLWGGFNVGNPTLNRFYSFHFILPLFVLVFVMIHILFLHNSGSSNPLGLTLNLDKIVFYNFFVVKDLVTLIMALFVLMFSSINFPFLFMDHENFIYANPMNTPVHIQPEWYFLFAYAILRSIPNKMGGVIFLVLSILIVLILPFLSLKKIKGNRFNPLMLILFWFHVGSFLLLTWLGSMPVEDPFVKLSKLYTFFYFVFYFISPWF